MTLSMAHLLIHSDSVPRETRQALLAASSAPPEGRSAHLEPLRLHGQGDIRHSNNGVGDG